MFLVLIWIFVFWGQIGILVTQFEWSRIYYPGFSKPRNFREIIGFWCQNPWDYFVHFSILKILRFFLLKNRAKCRWVFILFQPKVGSHFWRTQISCPPLEIPLVGPQNLIFFSALRARVFILSKKNPLASRGFLFCLFFFQIFVWVFNLFIFLPDFRVGSYFVQFPFPQNPPGFLLKGGIP